MESFFSFFHRYKKGVILTILLVSFGAILWAGELSDKLHRAYTQEISVQVFDREHRLIALVPNKSGEYMTEATSTPRLRALVVKSEDQYFYFHPGVNPWSLVRSVFHYLFFREHVGGSTITQQLVKNLLHQENERTISNKISELCYAIALELYTDKEEILSMYINSAFFGNQRVGAEEASQYYFGKSAGSLSDGEIVRLLALLARPSLPPGSAGNTESAKVIAKRIGVSDIGSYEPLPRSLRENKKDPAMFELTQLVNCTSSCTLTIDQELTKKIREVVRVNLSSPKFASVGNAAVAVIRIGKTGAPNELLALVGSPDPYGTHDGSQINMALASRPIGSTWKPFIYGMAIEKGARPYTVIDDSEYRFEIGTGYAFYPKNYDGIYRGPVTLHYALSNSLNVPAVRALQFDGINRFGEFMQDELGFIPRQSFDTYQLSVALGGLEMNPLLLAHYFSLFPRNGVLAPLSLIGNTPIEIPMSKTFSGEKRIFSATTTALMNKMLSDRLLGVEQFGLESNLNLPFKAYAVKTGTTYDYHDSWTVGYTPDVVVVAWIGNSDNKAMNLLTGAQGAGKIWHDTMALLNAEGIIVPKEFDTSELVDITTPEGYSFGLPHDDVTGSRLLMQERQVVLEPHDEDVLRFEKGMSIPLRGTVSLSWSIDGTSLGEGTELFFEPTHAGTFVLKATQKDSGETTTLRIHIVD